MSIFNGAKNGMGTQTQFIDFLADIEPSATTKSQASGAHTSLRRYLRDHEDFCEIHLDTFLAGSYRRDTSNRPRTVNGQEQHPDVDIIVVTNHTRQDQPQRVLNNLRRILAEDYDIDNKPHRRSVGVYTAAVDMDVVPIIAPTGLDGTLYLPDKSLDQWIETNPLRHIAWSTEINQATGGRFKPLVKLVKWWRRANPTISPRPKGFVIECIVAECMNHDETDYAELFLHTLENIVDRYKWDIKSGRVPFISDPGVPRNSVTSNITISMFEGLYNKAEAHARSGREAQSASPENALAIWREIFSARFPANGNGAKSLLNEAFVPSALTFPDKPVTPRKPGGFA
jgi:hypothetical protein